jgi:hypothetical protein
VRNGGWKGKGGIGLGGNSGSFIDGFIGGAGIDLENEDIGGPGTAGVEENRCDWGGLGEKRLSPENVGYGVELNDFHDHKYGQEPDCGSETREDSVDLGIMKVFRNFMDTDRGSQRRNSKRNREQAYVIKIDGSTAKKKTQVVQQKISELSANAISRPKNSFAGFEKQNRAKQMATDVETSMIRAKLTSLRRQQAYETERAQTQSQSTQKRCCQLKQDLDFIFQEEIRTDAANFSNRKIDEKTKRNLGFMNKMIGLMSGEKLDRGSQSFISDARIPDLNNSPEHLKHWSLANDYGINGQKKIFNNSGWILGSSFPNPAPKTKNNHYKPMGRKNFNKTMSTLTENSNDSSQRILDPSGCQIYSIHNGNAHSNSLDQKAKGSNSLINTKFAMKDRKKELSR